MKDTLRDAQDLEGEPTARRAEVTRNRTTLLASVPLPVIMEFKTSRARKRTV